MKPSITFYGDVFLTHPVETASVLPQHFVFNLEAPLTDRGSPYPGKINLRTSPRWFDATFSRLPRAVCLANNHILDYGEEGLAQTLRFLTERNVQAFGAGTLEENCNNPIVIDVEGIRVALTGYVSPTTSPILARPDEPGCMPIRMSQVRADVASAKDAGAHFIVVHVHWGDMFVPVPRPQDVELAREIVAGGADLVIGHHAHCIQGYESFSGSHVFFGLGNFIFPDYEAPSYHDDQGRPTRMKRLWSFASDRESLAATLHVDDGSISVARVRFDGEAVTTAPDSVEHHALHSSEETAYATRYQRAYRLANLRRMILTYFRDPKLPSFARLRGAFKSILDVD